MTYSCKILFQIFILSKTKKKELLLLHSFQERTPDNMYFTKNHMSQHKKLYSQSINQNFNWSPVDPRYVLPLQTL